MAPGRCAVGYPGRLDSGFRRNDAVGVCSLGNQMVPSRDVYDESEAHFGGARAAAQDHRSNRMAARPRDWFKQAERDLVHARHSLAAETYEWACFAC